MTSANHQYKQIRCYCRTVWAPASFFWLKLYFIYCQHRGNAFQPFPCVCHCLLGGSSPMLAEWLGCSSGPPAQSHILWDMNHSSKETGALQLFRWSWRVLGKECPCSESPRHRGCFLWWFLDQWKPWGELEKVTPRAPWLYELLSCQETERLMKRFCQAKQCLAKTPRRREKEKGRERELKH